MTKVPAAEYNTAHAVHAYIRIMYTVHINKVVLRCGSHLAGAISLKPKPELSGSMVVECESLVEN